MLPRGPALAAASLSLDAAAKVGTEAMLWVLLCSRAMLLGICLAFYHFQANCVLKVTWQESCREKGKGPAMLKGWQKIGSIQDSGESHRPHTFFPKVGSKINSHKLWNQQKSSDT